MEKQTRHTVEETLSSVQQLGAFIAIARKRRGWRQSLLATKAGVHENTLRKVEAGELGTSIGAYAAALWALGLIEQLNEVARPERDAVGELLSQVQLGTRTRSTGLVDDDF